MIYRSHLDMDSCSPLFDGVCGGEGCVGMVVDWVVLDADNTAGGVIIM